MEVFKNTRAYKYAGWTAHRTTYRTGQHTARLALTRGRAITRTLSARADNPALARPFIQCSLELGGCDAAYAHKDKDLP